MLVPYLNYLWKARNEHGIHPPFLYKLYTEIIKEDVLLPVYLPFEKRRIELVNDNRIIEVTDLGAGSKSGNRVERKISQIAKQSLSPQKYCRLYYRLIRHFEPINIFELGTSLGINTLYMASANNNATVYSFEGCPNIAGLARNNFSSLQATNIELITGEFNHTFPEKLKTIKHIDLLFIDGNHRYEPTLFYFKEALTYVHEKSVIIIDDIYWSEEMQRVWLEIKKHPDISLTIDLFKAGIVFFDKKLSKQDFILRY